MLGKVSGVLVRRGTDWEARIYLAPERRAIASVEGSWAYVRRGLVAVGLVAPALPPVGLDELDVAELAFAAEDVALGLSKCLAEPEKGLDPESSAPVLETADL